jgi:UbiD family decarboxylase
MGYEAGKSSPKPVFRVNAITYRNDPIRTFPNMGMPIRESQTVTALIKGTEVYAELRKLGPFLPLKERLLGDAAGVIFDCTWPKD